MKWICKKLQQSESKNWTGCFNHQCSDPIKQSIITWSNKNLNYVKERPFTKLYSSIAVKIQMTNLLLPF